MAKVVHWDQEAVGLTIQILEGEVHGESRRLDQLLPRGSRLWSVVLYDRKGVKSGEHWIEKELHVQRDDMVVYSNENQRKSEVLSSPAFRCLPSGARVLAVYFRQRDEILDLSDVLWRRAWGLDIPNRSLNDLNRIEMALGARGVHI